MLTFSFPANLVPPDMYRATMPDGHIIRESNRSNWYLAIKSHYDRNGYGLPPDWEQFYEDRLCRILPPGFCVNEAGQGFNAPDIRINIDDLKHGMQVLWAITRDEQPLVDSRIAEKRAAICAACPANMDVPGCKPCIQLANTIMDIKGRGVTKADPFLRSCVICKCSNEAQVWVKKDLLMKGNNSEQLARMRELNPECWKANPSHP